jgi:hypothetical protein
LYNRPLNGMGSCQSDNISVMLDDEAGGGPVQGVCNGVAPAVSGTRTPNLSLALFDNLAMGGIWTLTPNDLASGDGGTFQQWCITIIYE